jgi:hypothetical protein
MFAIHINKLGLLTVCTGIFMCWISNLVAKIIDFLRSVDMKSNLNFLPLMTLPAVIQLTPLYCSQTPNNDGPYPSQRSKNTIHI